MGLSLLPPPLPSRNVRKRKAPLHLKTYFPQARPLCLGQRPHRAPTRCHKGPPATRLPLTSWSGCPALELTSSGLLLMAELRPALIPSCAVRLGKPRVERGTVLVTGREPKGGNEGGPDVVMRVGLPVSSLLPQFECLSFFFRSALKDRNLPLVLRTGEGEMGMSS